MQQVNNQTDEQAKLAQYEAAFPHLKFLGIDGKNVFVTQDTGITSIPCSLLDKEMGK